MSSRDGYGIPLGIASADANRHDSPLLPHAEEAAGGQLDGILPEDPYGVVRDLRPHLLVSDDRTLGPAGACSSVLTAPCSRRIASR